MKNVIQSNQNVGSLVKLTREELRNVTGGDFASCYNVCMSGFDFSAHTQEAIKKKTDGCVSGCQVT